MIPPPTFLLDTDHISDLERGNVRGTALRERLRALPPDNYGTTIVNFEEQVRGRLAQIAAATNAEQEIAAYEHLQECRRVYTAYAVADYSPKAAAIFALLVRQKIRVGTKDLKIAAIALANDAVLLTRNTKDFGKILGLKIEDWTTYQE